MMMDIDTMIHVTHPPLWSMWFAFGWCAAEFLGKLLTMLRRK